MRFLSALSVSPSGIPGYFPAWYQVYIRIMFWCNYVNKPVMKMEMDLGTYKTMKLVEDLENGYIARPNIFRDVLEIVRLGAIETGNLICRNLYCVL